MPDKSVGNLPGSYFRVPVKRSLHTSIVFSNAGLAVVSGLDYLTDMIVEAAPGTVGKTGIDNLIYPIPALAPLSGATQDMAKLYTHIGLPKTATTALQQGFFPFIENESLSYAGVLQPRTTAQTPLYETFCQAVDRGGASIDVARHEIEEILRTGKSLILSEEMILVSRAKTDWRDKLTHLSALVKGLDYELILTVREPTRALFSYYAEVLPTLLKETGRIEDEKGFLARAKADPWMEIFHYKKLMNELGKHFDLSRIFIKKFEEVIAGDLGDLLRLFDLPEESSPGKLPAENQRRESSDYVYTNERVTLGEFLMARCAWCYTRNPGLQRSLYRLCRSLSKRLKINLREIKVKKPDDQEMDELTHYLQQDIDWLAQRHGVDYRSRSRGRHLPDTSDGVLSPANEAGSSNS